MRSRRALTKLQTVLLIDILIVAIAATGYYYVSSLPGPSLSSDQIQFVGLTINPSQAFVGQSVGVSINVTNTGSEGGTYSTNLTLDGEASQALPIELASGETKLVQFTLKESTEGVHLISIGNLQGSLTIVNTIELTDLAVNRTEAKVGEPIGISLIVTNQANETGNYSTTLTINDKTFQTKTGILKASASTNVLFEVLEQIEGTYHFEVGLLNGTFNITSAAPPAQPAEFLVSNLTIDPDIAQPGMAVNVTAKITNVGETSGSYTADFVVNTEVKGNQTLQLSGGETKTVVFTVTESTKGSYSINIGNATGTLSVQDPSTIKLTNMIVRPYEVWAGQSVSVIVKGTNTGTGTSSLSLRLKIGTSDSDMSTLNTQTLTLTAGAEGSANFSVTAPALQGGDSLVYLIDVNGLQGGFMVVKNGYHTLNVEISPRGDAKFHIILTNGVNEEHITFWSALLPEGTYTVVMPATDPTGKITFQNWDDGSTSLTKTFGLTSRMTLTAIYKGGTSCPSLYMWNGTDYVYVAEVSNHGWLGYTRYVNSDGSMEYWRNNPWDYIVLNSSQIQESNGAFNLTLTQRWDEIFFIDSAYMMVVDHPTNVSAYSTMVEQYIDPNYMGQIYTVNNPAKPVSAYNELISVVNGTVTGSSRKTDVLSQISSPDGVSTTGFNGKYSPAWDNQTWNRLTLNLGNLSGAPQIKLVVKAMVDFGPADSYNLWMNKFYVNGLPNHTEPTPTPYMEVKDASGNWIRVPEDRQFPLAPDGIARTFVVDLTGLFPTNNFELRISSFWNVTYDYIGVDTSLQQNTTIYRINPQAFLKQAFLSNSMASGNFTQYGNVTQLLLNEDDEFVIGKLGDSVSMIFPTTNLTAIPAGMQRDYFFFVACWFKTEYANYGFGPQFGFTVDPLPFHNMTGFPYPLATEYYPNDTAHLAYLRQWNTRTIYPPITQQVTAPNQSLLLIEVVLAIIIAFNVSYAAFRLRARHSHIQKRQTIK